jgi:glycosyltransferase involved in cell wall biosynthesis
MQMAQRRIVQVIQGVSNPSAGPTYSVARLAEELVRIGERCEVSALGGPPRDWPSTVELIRHDEWLVRKLGLSFAQWFALRELSAEESILHGHGIWRSSNLFSLWLPKVHRAKVIVSPRGMLSEWSLNHKRWRKMPFWLALQKPALARVDAFHATAQIEYEDIRRAGFRQPVAIIPNGVEIPPIENVQKRRQLVFLSRIDPKKGLEMLISIWARLAPDYPEWELTIAGPLGDHYANSVQALAAESRAPRISFAGQVSGLAKQTLLSSASLFVLPTYSENFGIAIAEALAHGTPVVTTTGTPWRDLSERGAGWWVEPSVAPIEAALRAALSLPMPALAEMGQRGRSWMEADFGWRQIAVNMQATYDWLIKRETKPDFVVTD